MTRAQRAEWLRAHLKPGASVALGAVDALHDSYPEDAARNRRALDAAADAMLDLFIVCWEHGRHAVR